MHMLYGSLIVKYKKFSQRGELFEKLRRFLKNRDYGVLFKPAISRMPRFIKARVVCFQSVQPAPTPSQSSRQK